MTPYIQALRAITATVFRRLFRPILWVLSGVAIILLLGVIALGIWVNTWWLLLLIILIPLVLIAGGILVLLWWLSGKLLPRHVSVSEQQQLLGFADKLIRFAELRSTPLPVMAALIAKDVVRGKKSSFVEDLINDSKGLKGDVTALRDMFT